MTLHESHSKEFRVGSEEHLVMLASQLDPRCADAVVEIIFRKKKGHRRKPYASFQQMLQRCARETNAPEDQVLGLYGLVRSKHYSDLFVGLDDEHEWVDPTGTPVEAAIRIAQILKIVWGMRR